MDHQNIVKLYEVYEDEINFYLIMDLLKGGELFDEIVKRSKFSENDAAEIMF
jgi:serine/threonine protein kinase